MPTVLESLRRRRQPFAAILLGAMLVGLVAVLGQCLFADRGKSVSFGETAMEVTPGTMSCTVCRQQMDARSFDQGALAPPAPAFQTAVALLFLGVLFTLPVVRRVSIPPMPLLPQRPRTLKFCVLRI